MKHLNTKMKCLIVVIVLISGCRICLVCDGLGSPPCKTALPHVKPLLDSLYAQHYHVKKWAVQNCSYNDSAGEITLLTVTNPGKGELGIKLIFDTNYEIKDMFYRPSELTKYQ
jgi:hypothetical protein